MLFYVLTNVIKDDRVSLVSGKKHADNEFLTQVCRMLLIHLLVYKGFGRGRDEDLPAVDLRWVSQ